MPRMYRCPNCNTLNTEGVPPFPLCSKCGIDLICCRYCRYFNAKTLECLHPLQLEVQVITDPDTIPASCDLFHSRLIVGEEHLRTRVTRTLGIAVAAAAVLLLSLWGIFLRGAKAPAEWELDITFPQQLIRGSYFPLNIRITNTGTEPLPNLALRFPLAFFNNFLLQSTVPVLENDVRGNSFYFRLPSLDTGQSLIVQLYLVPQKEGSFSAACELLSQARGIDSRLLRFRVVAPTGAVGTPMFAPR